MSQMARDLRRDVVIDLSVVIPLYNEEENLRPLVHEICLILEKTARPFELICVDDGSTDNGLSVLRALRKEHSELRVIRHKFNCGQSAAQATGFGHARGKWVITLDADQQNDPSDIPLLLETAETADAVCGIRMQRKDSWVKRLSSRIGNGFRNWVTGDSVTDTGCALRVIRREALKEIPIFNGMHRFLPTLLRLQGFTVVEIPVNHRPRTRGESKYGIRNRMFRGLIDCFAILWWRRRCLPATRFLPEDEASTS